MTVYVKEKWAGRGAPNPNSTKKYDWELAHGFDKRSYPVAKNDSEAIAIFKSDTEKVKKCAYRLISLNAGLGYSTSLNVLAQVNC